MSNRKVTSPADLEQIDGFAFVAGDSLIATCDELATTEVGAVAAEQIIDAGAVVLSLSARSDRETKRRNLRAMTLGHFARFWKSRQPVRTQEQASDLADACRVLVVYLAPIIASRRPAPLRSPRLEGVKSGVFRRRLDNFAPMHARALEGALGFVEHGLTLKEWIDVGPSVGVPKNAKPAFEAIVDEVRRYEAASEEPRAERAAAFERVAHTHPGLEAAAVMLAEQASASAPVDELKGRVVARYVADEQMFTVHCPHYLACLESSSCSSAEIDLGEPLSPSVMCMQRPQPCTLKRLTAEIYAEAMAGV